MRNIRALCSTQKMIHSASKRAVCRLLRSPLYFTQGGRGCQPPHFVPWQEIYEKRREKKFALRHERANCMQYIMRQTKKDQQRTKERSPAPSAPLRPLYFMPGGRDCQLPPFVLRRRDLAGPTPAWHPGSLESLFRFLTSTEETNLGSIAQSGSLEAYYYSKPAQLCSTRLESDSTGSTPT